MKRRWRTGCLVAVFAAVALLGALVLLRQPVGRFVLARALGVVAGKLGVEVSYQRVEGNLYRNPRFVGVRLAMDGHAAEVDELAIRYDPLGFLRGRIPVSELVIVRPRVALGPLAGPDTTAGLEWQFPRLNLRRLSLVNGELSYLGEPRLDSVNLELGASSVPGRARLSVRSFSARLVREDIRLRQLTAQAYATPESLVLVSAEIATDRSALAGDFRLRLAGPGVEGTVSSLRVDLAEFTDYRGLFRASGSASLDTTGRKAELDYSAEGSEFEGLLPPRLDGSLKLDGDRLTFTAAGEDTLLGRFRVDAAVDVVGLRYSGTARLRGASLRPLDPGLPDVRFDADLDFGGVKADSVGMSLQGKLADLGIDTLRLVGSYRSGQVRVSELELNGGSGRLWASGSHDGGVLAGRCLLDSFNLGLAGRLAGIDIRGRVWGVARGSGTLDSFALAAGLSGHGVAGPGFELRRLAMDCDATLGRSLEGRVAVGAEDATIGGVVLEAVQLTLLDSDLDLRVDREQDRLLVRGEASVGRDSVDLGVTMFRFAAPTETLELARPFRASWGPQGLAVTGLEYEVADGMLRLDVSQSGSAAPVVDLRADSVDLRKLQKLLGLDFELWGTVSLALSGQDTFALALEGGDLEAPAIGLKLKSLALAAGLTREWLSLDRLALVHAVETTVVTGTVGYTLAPRFELGDVNLDANLADPGPWVLFFLDPTLRLERGKLYAELALRGELMNPDLSGRARIVRGVLAVPPINTVAENVNAELTLRRNRIVLEKLSGGSGTGTITASGFVDLGRDWQVDTLFFSVRPDKATTNPIPEVFAVVSGWLDLALAADRPLSIEGDVDVEEALLAFGFGQTAAPAPAGDSAPLVFDVRVRGDRDIWLRNQLVDIELSVDMAIRQTMAGALYTGQLATRQGNIYYLDHTLRVTRGVIAFDNIEQLNPALDIVAELPVSGKADNLPERILLTLSGTLEKPEFRFSSEPAGWDENEIITYLTLNVTTAELSALENREEVARYLSGRLLGIFQTQVTKQVRKWISLDALSFESELTGGEGYKVTVGKYVGQNIYVTYTQNFTGDMLPEFRVEYYLDRRNEIVGARNEDGRFSVLYRFRLRY
ncbi:translocation/assembly module TamB domain-containing protein [candidate division WOR-3 bacterium]|nr:translocation/assembly module TamB domain-containing protein [candidate division WOR-3 bacterium]